MRTASFAIIAARNSISDRFSYVNQVFIMSEKIDIGQAYDAIADDWRNLGSFIERDLLVVAKKVK